MINIDPRKDGSAVLGVVEDRSPSQGGAASPAAVEIVILDDDVDLEALRRCVAAVVHLSAMVRVFQSASAVRDALLERPCDLLFVDYHLGVYTAMDALELLGEAGLDPTTVLVTDGQGEDVIRDAIHGGFYEYIPKRSVTPDLVEQVIRSSPGQARLQAEIGQNQNDLAESVRTLEASQEEINRFCHSVSHELKTPLTGAREFLSLVHDEVVGPVTEEQLDLLGAAIRSCNRMVTCINDVLDASRVETGKLLLSRVHRDLGSVVKDAVNGLRGIAPAFIDPDRIFQVVANLMSNAIKFTPEGGEILVRVSGQAGGGAQVSVASVPGEGASFAFCLPPVDPFHGTPES